MKKHITSIALSTAVATSFCLAENKVVDAGVKSMRDGSTTILVKVSKSESKPPLTLDAARLDLRRSSSFGSRIRGVGEVQQTAAHAIDKIDDELINLRKDLKVAQAARESLRHTEKEPQKPSSARRSPQSGERSPGDLGQPHTETPKF